MAAEILDERLLYPSYEIIGGEKIMSPAANLTHSDIIGRLYLFIGNHLMANKSGYIYPDNVDVHFSDGSFFRPDLVVVLKSNEKILAGRKNIFGAPDMVVEVLSYSTRNRDLTIKKDTYEAQGVKEYWIVDPWAKSVTVYLLRDGKYEFSGLYQNWSEDELARLSEDERAAVEFEIPVNVLDGFKVKIKNIFGWYIE